MSREFAELGPFVFGVIGAEEIDELVFGGVFDWA